MQWVKESLAGRERHITTVGIAYFYAGAWVPNIAGKAKSADPEFQVGPHIRIVSPHENQSELQLKDGDNVPTEFDAVIEIPRGST
ncbi:MAG: hypothetical protein WB630_11885 [Candidatus Acidiferrales bacterium]